MRRYSAPVLFAQHRAVWARQANWYVDPADGDDRNAGDVLASPLKTLAELALRLGGLELQQSTTVWLLGDVDEHLTLSVSLAPTDESSRVLVRGHATAFQTVYTGSVTAVTQIQKTAPGESLLLTDGAIGDWAPHVGLRGRWTSGANVGGTFWPVKRVSATQARCTPSVNPFDPTTNFSPSIQAPSIGDAFVIERLPGLHGVQLEVTRPSHAGFGAKHTCGLAELEIGKTLAAPEHGAIELRSGLATQGFTAWVGVCRILVRETVLESGATWGSLFDAGSWAAQKKSRFRGAGLNAGGCIGAQECSAPMDLVVAGGYTVQDGLASSPHGWRSRSKWSVQLGGMAVFDTIGDAIHLGQDDFTEAIVLDTIYGQGATAFGVQIDAGCLLRVQAVGNMPTITGAGGELELGGASNTWAVVTAGPGVVDTAKLCGVVVV